MYYVYSLRCQPFNLLNQEELKWLVNNIPESDQIIVGIVNPHPNYIDTADKATTWTRFKIEYNPLNYWERFCMVKNFIDKSNYKDKIAGITPLPRPSTNMEKARNYLPSDYTMCLSIVHNSEQEEMKEYGLKSQGETNIKIIPAYTFSKNITIISPELICCLMAIDGDDWKELVSDDVRNYLVDNNVSARAKCMKRGYALNVLKTIYNRTTNDEEKIILFGILNKYIDDINPPSIIPVSHQNPKESDIDALIISIEELHKDLSLELPSLIEDAPKQFELFSSYQCELYEMKSNGKKGLYKNPENFRISKERFEAIRKEWDKRNK